MKTGCIAYDTIQEVDSTSLKELNGTSSCVVELHWKSKGTIDLLFILSICFAIHNDKWANRYTLQRYNCYFLSWAIIGITMRKSAVCGAVFNTGKRVLELERDRDLERALVLELEWGRELKPEPELERGLERVLDWGLKRVLERVLVRVRARGLEPVLVLVLEWVLVRAQASAQAGVRVRVREQELERKLELAPADAGAEADTKVGPWLRTDTFNASTNEKFYISEDCFVQLGGPEGKLYQYHHIYDGICSRRSISNSIEAC
ncbi:hypothetical protein PILCRDRAFT_195630 [Piloderma croceum F 1598]|uniref:Uncharacterized protein n=1 Tax=Piloderma croceum (strain F 1598) TaxID=765440 RepID=A0A0C3CJ70_PILCF|nr:hypothetical protein PILCRDRAFT_195630 [Piloderma croceum F 1598]